jgi:magnesium-transporting ATPase (P-type)
VKGAPEEVLKLCTQTLDQNAQPIQFLNDAKEGQLMQKQDGNPDEKNIWSMAADGLKVISYAFKEIETAELDRLFQSYSDESDEFRWELEQDLIYLCTFGMEDPCRVGLRGHV